MLGGDNFSKFLSPSGRRRKSPQKSNLRATALLSISVHPDEAHHGSSVRRKRYRPYVCLKRGSRRERKEDTKWVGRRGSGWQQLSEAGFKHLRCFRRSRFDVS